MKYIDVVRLKAEIEKRMHICDGVFEKDSDTYYQGKAVAYQETLSLIDSLQQEQTKLPSIGYAETYYQKGLRDGIIKGRMEILEKVEEIEKRKAESILVIKEQEQPIGEEYAIEIGKYTHTLRVGSKSDIDNLIRQEKQEQPDVDFEKELKSERTKLLDVFGPMNGEQSLAVKNFARHFVELGLNARKEG